MAEASVPVQVAHGSGSTGERQPATRPTFKNGRFNSKKKRKETKSQSRLLDSIPTFVEPKLIDLGDGSPSLADTPQPTPFEAGKVNHITGYRKKKEAAKKAMFSRPDEYVPNLPSLVFLESMVDETQSYPEKQRERNTRRHGWSKNGNQDGVAKKVETEAPLSLVENRKSTPMNQTKDVASNQALNTMSTEKAAASDSRNNKEQKKVRKSLRKSRGKQATTLREHEDSIQNLKVRLANNSEQNPTAKADESVAREMKDSTSEVHTISSNFVRNEHGPAKNDNPQQHKHNHPARSKFIVCYNCLKKGHRARDCSKKAPNDQSIDQKTQNCDQSSFPTSLVHPSSYAIKSNPPNGGQKRSKKASTRRRKGEKNKGANMRLFDAIATAIIPIRDEEKRNITTQAGEKENDIGRSPQVCNGANNTLSLNNQNHQHFQKPHAFIAESTGPTKKSKRRTKHIPLRLGHDTHTRIVPSAAYVVHNNKNDETDINSRFQVSMLSGPAPAKSGRWKNVRRAKKKKPKPFIHRPRNGKAFGMTFFDLPGEIRNEIYSYLLVSKNAIDLWPLWSTKRAYFDSVPFNNSFTRIFSQFTHGIYPNILLSCKSIHEEASSIFYGGNSFRFTERKAWVVLGMWLNTIGKTNTSYIQDISIHIPEHLGITQEMQQELELELRLRHMANKLNQFAYKYEVNWDADLNLNTAYKPPNGRVRDWADTSDKQFYLDARMKLLEWCVDLKSLKYILPITFEFRHAQYLEELHALGCFAGIDPPETKTRGLILLEGMNRDQRPRAEVRWGGRFTWEQMGWSAVFAFVKKKGWAIEKAKALGKSSYEVLGEMEVDDSGEVVEGE